MRHLPSLIAILIFLLSSGRLAGQLISFHGKEYYVAGVNMPWNNFGLDFGVHPEWGTNYDPDFFEEALSDIAEAGLNSVRLWLHCDGRANPNFDAEGFVTGLDPILFDQLDDFFARAEAHNLMVVLVLWSHDMLEDRRADAGPFAGNHADLIQNPAKAESYLDLALEPLVIHLQDRCNLLAWEVFSEPEWGMDIFLGGSTEYVVEPSEMQLFIGKCILRIREFSDQLITLGSSYAFGNHPREFENLWHASAFGQLGLDCEKAYLDFYSFHYFDWMWSFLSPFKHPTDKWELDRPVLISESATYTDEDKKLYRADEQLDILMENEYAGLMIWSYGSGDEYSQWSDFSFDLMDFTDQHADLITVDHSCDNPVQEDVIRICHIYPNPVQERLFIDIHDGNGETVLLEIFDNLGRQVFIQESPLMGMNTLELNISNLLDACYWLRVQMKMPDGTRHVYRELLVKG